MNFEEYTSDRLWTILVEAVHELVMYPHHKAYVRDVLFPEKPDMKAEELASKLKISLGEALVILCELTDERKQQH